MSRGGKIIHGHAKRGSTNPVYVVWCAMISRCENPKNKNYAQYGARGIRVHSRWRNSFAAFLADVGERPIEGKLERIDNDGNYEPGNVRWATQREQTRNTRRTVLLTFDGKTMCVADWAEALGIKRWTVYGRIKLGWPIERVLSEAVR
jgi:hypothetical protein